MIDWLNARDLGAKGDGIADDTQAIQDALAEAGQSLGTVYLPAGRYRVSRLIVSSATLRGAGPGSVLIPAGPGGPLVSLAGKLSRLHDLQFYGGSDKRGSNPAGDAISVQSGGSRMWIGDIWASYLNGWVLNPETITSNLHLTVRGLKGTNCAGGVRIAAQTGIAVQAALSDIDLQQCETREALYLEHAYDVAVSQYNASVLGPAGIPTVRLRGDIATCFLGQLDCGVFGAPVAGMPVLYVEDAAGKSPHDVTVHASLFQAGGVGVRVDGGCARTRFVGVTSKNNLGDGWQFNGTGSAISVDSCLGNGNNRAAKTAFDMHVTAAAYIGVHGFAFCSTGVTSALRVPTANHVTNSNATYPGGRTVTGIPGGW